jgi:regulatory protein
MHTPKKYNFTEALQRLRKYCAYQERCHQEVRQKARGWGFDTEDTDKLIVQLMEENFLNEERYAKALAGGKFRTKGWGKKKIVETLKQKGISTYLVNTSMKEIDSEDYLQKLDELMLKKQKTLKGEQPIVQKQKLARFALSKGYESELVWEWINKKFSRRG